MSMRAHYDPIHDVYDSPTQEQQLPQPQPLETPNKSRLNISSLLSDATPLLADGDSTVEMEEVKTDVKNENNAPPTGTFPTSKKKKPKTSKLEGALAGLKVPINKIYKKVENGKQKRTNQTLIISAKQHHIKKKDGEPLWRKDIQFDFLSEVFKNPLKAFTNPYQNDHNAPDYKLSFADLYILIMANSPKTSKILKDRLLTDKSMAVPVGMVSLLVNVGRMNTTINFVPEMKSQLRTFHSIPCLQEGKKQHNKILQDSPRLKSILKSCCEYKGEPTNFQELFENVPEQLFPKTNAVNIIFLLCSFEHLISQHFDKTSLEAGSSKTFFIETAYKDLNLDNVDLTNPLDSPFNCIFLNFNSTPESRARRFLWLMYAYLETNLKKEELLNNPFQFPEDPLSVPPLEQVPEGAQYDIDTPEEIEYAEVMQNQRKKFLFLDTSHESGDKSHPKVDNPISTASPKGPKTKTEKIKVEEKNGDDKLPQIEGSNLASIKRGGRGKQAKTLKLTKAEKRKIENGSSVIKEFKPEEIYSTIYNQNKMRFRKKRHLNGNVSFFNHLINTKELIEEEDFIYDSNGKLVDFIFEPAEGEKKSDEKKKRYTGDFGEFSSTCVKMFKLAASHYEKNYIEENSQNDKVEVEVEQDGLRLTKFSIDVL